MQVRRHGGSDVTLGQVPRGSVAWGRRQDFASQRGRDGSRLRQHGRRPRRAPRWSMLGRSVRETGRSVGRRRSPPESNVQQCHRGKEQCQSPAIEEPRHEPPSTASAAPPFTTKRLLARRPDEHDVAGRHIAEVKPQSVEHVPHVWLQPVRPRGFALPGIVEIRGPGRRTPLPIVNAACDRLTRLGIGRPTGIQAQDV